MNIYEASLEAIKQKKFFQSDRLKKLGLKIKPTNTEICCACYKILIGDTCDPIDDKLIALRWQPQLIDLIDETYEVLK